MVYRSFSFIILFVFVAMLSACKWQKNTDGDDLIVSVFEKNLTVEEISGIVPDQASFQDSLELSQKYIQEWVSKELLLEKAKLNIGEDEDIQLMVDEYRNSLLVSRYLQLMVEQKAENEPTVDEVSDYYQLFKDNFLLKENIIRGSFLKLQAGAPRLADVKRWIHSSSEEDSLLLDDYCFQNATNFEHFGEKWVSMNTLANYLPEDVNVNNRNFKGGKLIEQSDSLYLYFLKLENVKLVNDTAPMEFVSPRIYKILRHQKKLNYLSLLKKSIYDEAIKDKVVVFYDEN